MELATEQRTSLVDILWSNIDESVVYTAIAETVEGIDELASHHYIEEVETQEISVIAIDHNSVHFNAEGFVNCELQWGSNGDQNRGNGATMSTSFPFTCRLISNVNDPHIVKTDGTNFRVDNSSWYE